jgi:hypothetical protein
VRELQTSISEPLISSGPWESSAPPQRETERETETKHELEPPTGIAPSSRKAAEARPGEVPCAIGSGTLIARPLGNIPSAQAAVASHVVSAARGASACGMINDSRNVDSSQQRRRVVGL